MPGWFPLDSAATHSAPRPSHHATKATLFFRILLVREAPVTNTSRKNPEDSDMITLKVDNGRFSLRFSATTKSIRNILVLGVLLFSDASGRHEQALPAPQDVPGAGACPDCTTDPGLPQRHRRRGVGRRKISPSHGGRYAKVGLESELQQLLEPLRLAEQTSPPAVATFIRPDCARRFPKSGWTQYMSAESGSSKNPKPALVRLEEPASHGVVCAAPLLPK